MYPPVPPYFNKQPCRLLKQKLIIIITENSKLFYFPNFGCKEMKRWNEKSAETPGTKVGTYPL